MTPAFLFVMSRHDISDEKWAVIGPLLEKKKTETRGRKRKDDRLMFRECPAYTLLYQFSPKDTG